MISLSNSSQSNFTVAECLRLEIVFFIVLFGNGREGGRKGWQIDKGRSLRLPLFFVCVPVGTRFRRLMAAGHRGGVALKCRKGPLVENHGHLCCHGEHMCFVPEPVVMEGWVSSAMARKGAWSHWDEHNSP